MNIRMVLYMLGRILTLEAAVLVLPLACGLIYGESSALYFAATAMLALAIGILLTVFLKPKNRTIFAREGFIIVSLAWILMSAIGALPFYLSGSIPSYTNAFFETVSGFTTTGASIVPNVEILDKGILFWRSFTHWIGGMGVLVLFMAIFPTDSGRSIHIMRAEMPGPIIDKLVPRIKSTAKILYLIYIVLTLVEMTLLMFDMDVFDSIVLSLGTAGTGGFAVRGDSLAGYSPYSQWVITVFMLIFGINFNLYYLILIKKFKSAFKSEELWTYLGIVAAAVALICYNTHCYFETFSETVRHSAFQVASIISTTGFSSTDFNLWPNLSKVVLLILMCIGACAGSTAGGIKISRVVILFKQIKAHLKHTLHPRSVDTVRFEGKPVKSDTLANVTSYLAIYVLCFLLILLIISILDPFSIETHISAVAACFNNIGPGFDVVGPMSNYSAYSDLSTWVLSFSMLLGRLEILPMLLLFAPSTWFKKKSKLK